MADISQLSDADLLSALGQQQPVVGVTQGVSAPLRIQMGNPQPNNPLAGMSDADLLKALGQQQAPSFTDKLATLWNNPPAGPSLIGAARSLYDAVATPGRVMQAAEDQAQRPQITDSDIPLSTATMIAPAANMAANIVLPVPGLGAGMSVLPKSVPAPAYGATSAQRKAAQIVSAPLTERGLSAPASVESAISAIGPEATLADTDPRLTQMAGTLAAKPGPAQQTLRDVLEARNAGAADRVIGTANDVMGAPVDLSALSDKIQNEAKAAVAPLYSDAYNVPVQASAELTNALQTPYGKAAVAKAKGLANSDLTAPPSAMFGEQKAGPDLSKTFSPDTLANMPDKMRASLEKAGVLNAAPGVDVRGLHLTRQALDDMISAASRQGSNNKVRVLNSIRSQVDKTLKSVEPFAQADKIYSTKAKIQDAIAEGMNVFKPSRTPEDVIRLLKSMTLAERSGYQLGARVAVRSVMGTARNDAAAARALFSKGYNQEKLSAILGKEDAQKILGRVSAEKAYANTDQRVLRNSETAARAYGKEALDNAHGIPSYRDVGLFSGVHGLARRALFGAVNSVLSAAQKGRQQAIESEVAKLLTLGRNDRAQILSALFREGSRRDPSGRLNAAIIPFVLEHAAAESRSSLPRSQ